MSDSMMREARRLADEGDLDGAERAYRRIAELAPEDRAALLALGAMLASVPPDGALDFEPGGRLRRACAAFDEAIRRAPHDRAAWLAKANVLMLMLHGAHALERQSATARMTPMVRFADVLSEVSELVDAALEHFPDDVEFVELRAEAFELR